MFFMLPSLSFRLGFYYTEIYLNSLFMCPVKFEKFRFSLIIIYLFIHYFC